MNKGVVLIYNKYNMTFRFAIIVIMCGYLLNGCTSFLAENPTGDLTQDTQYDGNSDLNALKNGPYRDLQLWDDGAGTFNRLPLPLQYFTGEAISEDAHIQFSKWVNDQVSGDLLDNFNNQWRDWFQGVQDANFSIHSIEDMTGVTDIERLKALGEVRTLRAYFYFNLVRYFGDVPLDTANVKNPANANLPRASLKKIYDEVIIPDLEFAVNQSGLEATRSSGGEVTKDVARAILADVYLTAAGYPYQEVATDTSQQWCEKGSWSMQNYPVNSQSSISFYKKAQTQLNALYNKYPLGAYSDLREPSMDNQGGAIFEVQYKDGIDNNDLIRMMFPNGSKNSQYGSNTGSFVPSMGYYNSYDPNDKRIQERVYFFTSDTKAKQYDPSESEVINFNRPYLYKFYDTQAVKETGRSGLNWPMYRYADVLLMLTEVNWSLQQLGVNVPSNDIVKGINEVRDRAGLSGYKASDITLKDIMSERAYELIFENKMIWDQRRTRKCLVNGNGEFSSLENFMGHKPDVYNYSFGPKNLLAPIPGREITRNSKMTQNFGYSPTQSAQ